MMLLALACATPDEPPCTVDGPPGLELAPADVDFGAFTEGDPLYYGVPPQGGALYSPFHVRVTGIASLDMGANVSMIGVDPTDGTLIAETDYALRFVCANVGESAGQWLGTDLHLRFGEWTMETLDGLAMQLEIAVENADGVGTSGTLEGVLAPM